MECLPSSPRSPQFAARPATGEKFDMMIWCGPHSGRIAARFESAELYSNDSHPSGGAVPSRYVPTYLLSVNTVECGLWSCSTILHVANNHHVSQLALLGSSAQVVADATLIQYHLRALPPPALADHKLLRCAFVDAE